MAHTHTKLSAKWGRVSALMLVVLCLVLSSPAFGHKAELSSWLTLQRDNSGWIALIEVRVPAKALELGVSMADVSRDGKLSEQEFSALARDYVRRVLAALDTRLGNETVAFKVEKVSWKGQGARTLDIVASVGMSTRSDFRSGRERLSVLLRKGGGTVVLAVQTQAPWYLSAASGIALGEDHRGFAHPLTLVAERPVQVDLVEGQPAR